MELVDLNMVDTAAGLRALGSAIWRGIPGVDVLVNLVLLPGSAVGADIVTVRTNGSGRPALSSRDLASIPLGRIAAHVQALALELTNDEPDGDRGRRARVMEQMSPEVVERAQRLAGAPKVGRPAHEPAFLQDVARVSLRLQARGDVGSLRGAVAAHFAKELGRYVSQDTVRDWWRAARKSLFLGPAPGPGARTITPGPRLNLEDPT